jgi:Fe2+ or Zn2+ uptake regulation protein
MRLGLIAELRRWSTRAATTTIRVVCQQCGKVIPHDDGGLDQSLSSWPTGSTSPCQHEVVLRGECERCAHTVC